MADATRIDDHPDDLGGVRARFRACVEADAHWRRNALYDLKFRAGTDGEVSYQWPVAAQNNRNTAGRPCLTINRVDPFLKQIENQLRSSNLGITVVPLKGQVSEAGAEARQGLLRHMVDQSDGEVAGDMIFSSMLTMGKGWAQAYSEYEDATSDDQEVKFRAVPDTFVVFIDPAANKPDRRDMRYGFVIEDLPREEFNLLYPDSGLAQGTLTLASLGADDKLNWFPGGAVRVADYYTVIEEVVKKKKTVQRVVRAVRHQKITGLEVLQETEIPIRRIPLVPEFGDIYRIDGHTDYCGMVRNGRHAQVLFNFSATSLAEQEDLAPKSPWLVTARQIEGYESKWNTANREVHAYLLYNDVDATGQPLTGGPPIRNAANPPIQGTVEALQMADMYLQEVFGLFNPSLGKAKSDQSGRAITALQQQGQIGNFNYLDNHKRFLRSLGQLLLEMAPVYYDTARTLRIVGKENNPKQVMFHAGAENAPSDDDAALQMQGVESVHDLSVGKYDVTVTTGPDYLSQRQQAVQSMIDVGKVAPQTVPVWIDLFFKNSDFPGAQEIYERMKRTISAQFQEQDPQDAQGQVAQLQAHLQAIGQQHDLLIKELNAKNHYIQSQQAETDRVVQVTKLNNDTKALIAAVNAQTQLTVGIAKVEGAAGIAELQARIERVTTLMEQAHDAGQADQDRAHEFAMAHVNASVASDQADQQQQNTLEQGQQAAALQPQPTAGDQHGQ